MSQEFFVVPHALHYDLIAAAYRHRGYTPEEAQDAARFCEMASAHGIRTHNGIKALHLDERFGSKAGGCEDFGCSWREYIDALKGGGATRCVKKGEVDGPRRREHGLSRA